MVATRKSFEEGHRRKFLVVIDDTPECSRALVYSPAFSSPLTREDKPRALVALIRTEAARRAGHEPPPEPRWITVRPDALLANSLRLSSEVFISPTPHKFFQFGTVRDGLNRLDVARCHFLIPGKTGGNTEDVHPRRSAAIARPWSMPLSRR